MSKAVDKRDSDRFDRLLSSYQKISFFLIFPPLVSAVTSLVVSFGNGLGLSFCLSLVIGLRSIGVPMLADFGICCGITALFVPIVVFASKGKLFSYLIGVALYLADFVYGFFLAGVIDTTNHVLSLVFHSVFLVAFLIGLVFYLRADSILKRNPKAILGKGKE